MSEQDDLLAQAQEVQRQALLKQAQAIQNQKLSGSQDDQAEPSFLDKLESYGKKGLVGAGKALDYVGGVTRTGLGAATLPNVDKGDVWNALKAQPLSGDDLLKRAGVPQGGHLSDVKPGWYSDPKDENNHWYTPEKGGALDFTGRGTGGLGLEVAADPLTYASFGMSGAAKEALQNGLKPSMLEKLTHLFARPVSTIGEDAGKTIYSGAFKNVDKDLAAMGKPAISPELLQSGFVGNMQGARGANLAI